MRLRHLSCAERCQASTSAAVTRPAACRRSEYSCSTRGCSAIRWYVSGIVASGSSCSLCPCLHEQSQQCLGLCTVGLRDEVVTDCRINACCVKLILHQSTDNWLCRWQAPIPLLSICHSKVRSLSLIYKLRSPRHTRIRPHISLEAAVQVSHL